MSQFYQVSDWASSLRLAHRDPTDDTYVKRCHKERESKQNCNDTRKRGEWVDVKLELLTVFAKPSSLEPKFAHWQIRIGWGVGQTLSFYSKTSAGRAKLSWSRLRPHVPREWSLTGNHPCLRGHVGAASLPQKGT